MRSIAFVDFGYLKRAGEKAVRSKNSGSGGQEHFSFSPEAMISWLDGESHPPLRAYWYYSQLPETHKSFGGQKEFFKAIGSEAKIQLRLGTLRQDKDYKSRANWLEECVKSSGGNVQQFMAKYRRKTATFHQKGIDTMLSLDMYRMAMADAYDIAYLVTGDEDMVHAVNLVQDLGKSVHLHVVNRSALSEALGMAVDDVNQIDEDHVKKMFKKTKSRQRLDDVRVYTDDHI